MKLFAIRVSPAFTQRADLSVALNRKVEFHCIEQAGTQLGHYSLLAALNTVSTLVRGHALTQDEELSERFYATVSVAGVRPKVRLRYWLEEVPRV